VGKVGFAVVENLLAHAVPLIPRPHPAVGKLHEDGHRDDDQHQIDHRQQRAVADVGAVAIFAEDETCDAVGGPAGPPAVTLMMMSASFSLKMMRIRSP
jgi:hypothetical protein